jgi:hypothetical protein
MLIVSRPRPGFILSPEIADAMREDRKRDLKALKKMTPEEVREMLRSRGLLKTFRPIGGAKSKKKKVIKAKAAR